MAKGKVSEFNRITIVSCGMFVQVTLPVYLNHTRAELLFTVDFSAQDVSLSKEEHSYYERGVAMFSSAL